MGLSILRAPHNEVAPHQPLTEAPTLEYYPGRGDFDGSSEQKPTCKLTIVARNHLKCEGDTDELIYGTLEVQGERISDSIGFTFKFEDVRFKNEALNAVWSIRATAHVGGRAVENGEFDLLGVFVTLDPLVPLDPVIKEERRRVMPENASTF